MSNSTETKHSLYKNWSVMNNKPDIDLSKLKLSSITFRVYHYLIYNMEYNNEIPLNQSECAKELGISRSKVYESIKILMGHGIIKKTPKKIATLCYYQVNPFLIYRGDKAKFSSCVNQYLDL